MSNTIPIIPKDEDLSNEIIRNVFSKLETLPEPKLNDIARALSIPGWDRVYDINTKRKIIKSVVLNFHKAGTFSYVQEILKAIGVANIDVVEWYKSETPLIPYTFELILDRHPGDNLDFIIDLTNYAKNVRSKLLSIRTENCSTRLVLDYSTLDKDVLSFAPNRIYRDIFLCFTAMYPLNIEPIDIAATKFRNIYRGYRIWYEDSWLLDQYELSNPSEVYNKYQLRTKYTHTINDFAPDNLPNYMITIIFLLYSQYLIPSSEFIKFRTSTKINYNNELDAVIYGADRKTLSAPIYNGSILYNGAFTYGDIVAKHDGSFTYRGVLNYDGKEAI